MGVITAMLALLIALVGEVEASAADIPRRVVSFNICADQLVVALADPAQIAGLSPYATDPTLSAVADEARAFRRIQWHAESTIPLEPDLVLVGPRDRSVTQRILTALGFRPVRQHFLMRCEARPASEPVPGYLLEDAKPDAAAAVHALHLECGLAPRSLADDRTLAEPHHATDAMIRSFDQIHSAAGLGTDMSA